jgi:hypothetical protein
VLTQIIDQSHLVTGDGLSAMVDRAVRPFGLTAEVLAVDLAQRALTPVRPQPGDPGGGQGGVAGRATSRGRHKLPRPSTTATSQPSTQPSTPHRPMPYPAAAPGPIMNPTCGSEAERLEPIMITAMYCAKCGSDVLADPTRPYVRCIKCDNLTTAAPTRPTKPQLRPILERRRCEHCGKLTLLSDVNCCPLCGQPKRLNERQ